MKRQNGVRSKGWAITSWEGEFPKYVPPNNIMEMEADASFVDDGNCSKEDFKPLDT